MADLDTTSKRRSHLSLGKPWMQVLPAMSGTIDQADRQHFAYLYSGILSGVSAVFPGIGDVRLGVVYGPTGADYTGTMVGTSPQIIND